MADFTVKINTRFPVVTEAIKAKVALATDKAAHDIEAQAKARSRVRTGFMRSSIKAEPVTPLDWTVTGYAQYTIYNELGTRHMSAQPMFMPAVEIVAPAYISALKQIAE